MGVFNHLLYEYSKGLRGLALYTFLSEEYKEVEQKLTHRNIPYLIQFVNEKKINVFFGNKSCIEVLQSFGNKPLNEYTIEEDFILGIMLGYNREEQCKRYLKQKKQAEKSHQLILNAS